MKFRPFTTVCWFSVWNPKKRQLAALSSRIPPREKPMEGKVIAVGAGARDEQGKVQPLDVKAGDAILFGKWCGTEVKIDGQDYLIMKESDIMGIID